MKATPILRKFLETGVLGELSLGMHVDEVLSLYGCDGMTIDEYRSRYQKEKNRTHVREFKVFPKEYGVLEILFDLDTDKVVFFKVFYLDGLERRLPTNLDDGWVTQLDGISKEGFKAILKECGIRSQREVFHPEVAQLAEIVTHIWIPSSQIRVNFDEEDDADQLIVISKSGPYFGIPECINGIDFT